MYTTGNLFYHLYLLGEKVSQFHVDDSNHLTRLWHHNISVEHVLVHCIYIIWNLIYIVKDYKKRFKTLSPV